MSELSLIQRVERAVMDPSLKDQFERVKVVDTMVWDRESEFALQLLSRNEFSMKTAMNNVQSLRDAITNVASFGITLAPAQKLAYLVPRDKSICLDISYMGMAHVAVDSGAVRMVHAELVYENDVFERQGVDKEPIHKRNDFAAPKDRGNVIGAYCVAKTAHGDFITDTMSIEEIIYIRDRTESWKAHVGPKKSRTPWATDPGEMFKKTVVRRAYKMWPRAKRLDETIHYMNTVGGEGINFDAAADLGDATIDVVIDQIQQAPNEQELSALKRKYQMIASDNQDRASYDKITDAARVRLRQLRGQSA